MDQMNDALDVVGINGGSLLRNLVTTLIAIFVARWLSRRVRTQLVAALYRRSFARNDALLMGRLASLAIYAFAGAVVLVAWGVNSTGILTALGAFSVALGLALQDVFRNFFSGILLLMEKPFRVGDHVQVQAVEGEVIGVDIRTTLVRAANGSTVMVPNSIMYSQILTTTSGRGVRRLDLQVTGQEVNVKRLSEIVGSGVKASGVVKGEIPPPIVVLTSAESTVLTISLLVPEDAESDLLVIEAIAAAAGDDLVEISRP